MKKRGFLHLILVNIILIMLFITSINGGEVSFQGNPLFIPPGKLFLGGRSSEAKIFLNNNIFLISKQKKLCALKKDITPLWIWNDEGEILYSAFINDFNSDSYKEILVVSKSFIMPSTKILDGKTGEIIKLFPITIKTYKNNYPSITNKVTIKDDKVILSNFKRIYEISGGDLINKKLDLQDFVNGLKIMNNHLIVSTLNEISLYDLNFNKIKTKKISIKRPSVFFGDSNFIIVGSSPKDLSWKIEIYNSNLEEQGSFSLEKTENLPASKFFIFSNQMAIFDKDSKELKLYDFTGKIKKEIKNVEIVTQSSGNFYYLLSDSKKIMELNSITNTERELFNISSFNTGKITLLDKNYFFIEKEKEIEFYNKNNFLGSYNLEGTTESKNIDGSDFLIRNYWPFNYFYKGAKGKINLTELKEKNIVSIREVGDLDDDGTKEVLIGFSENGDYSDFEQEGIEDFILLNTKAKSINKISFIPTGEELNKTINNLISQRNSKDTSINDKEKERDNLQKEINNLDEQISNETNETKINELEQKKESLQSNLDNLIEEINILNNQLGEIEEQLQNYQKREFKYSNKIMSYAIFNNGKKLFIMLSDKKYTVDLLTLKKEEKDILPNKFFVFLANIGDINSDNLEDIFFLSGEGAGVLNGKDYSLIWEKNITKDYKINEFQGRIYQEGSNFVIISYIKDNKRILGKINLQNGVFSMPTKNKNLNFFREIDGNLIFSEPEKEKIFIIMKNGKTFELNKNMDFQEGYSKGFSPVVFYDCNKDNKQDVLYVSHDFSDVYFKKKLICLDVDTGKHLKEIPNFKFYGKEMKVINNYLFIKEGIIYVLDLNDFKLVSGILETPYKEGENLMNKKGNQIVINNKKIIVNEKKEVDGDFELNFNPVNGIIITKVDDSFYDSTLENKQLIRLKKGSHDLEVSYFDLQNKQYAFNELNIIVHRSKSIFPYFVILIAIFVIVLGILKWKKLKR